MGQTAIIVPVKADHRKRRLASLFSEEERKQLVVAMLEDVLQALAKARVIDDTHVISSDREILRLAERYGAKSIQEEKDGGVNAAVETAIEKTRAYGSWMVIPADVPFIRPRDVRNAITLARLGASVVISPSRDFDGTNLLLLRKGAKMGLHYDDNSFENHTRDAIANSDSLAVYYSDTVGFDIDKVTDVHQAFRLGSRCSTLTYLARKRRSSSKLKMVPQDVSRHTD